MTNHKCVADWQNLGKPIIFKQIFSQSFCTSFLFRALNTEENTPLIFYDELEVHPMIYNVENDLDPRMEPTFQAIINRIGSPRNYGNIF